jgi:cyclase
MLSSDQTLFGRTLPAYPQEARPHITFSHSLTLHFNDETITITHYRAGHTGGDSVVRFAKANVVAIGDLYVGPMFAFVDLAHGGNALGMEATIRSLLADMINPDTKIVPGHRAPIAIKDLQTYDKILEGSIAFVRKQVAEGKSLASIQASLSVEWKKWESQMLPATLWASYVYSSILEAEGSETAYQLP